MTDIVERLRAATFTKGRVRTGAGGQTIEATMRATLHEISQWDLEEAADEIERLRAALENVTIAYGMGWDMDGVIEVASAALTQGDE